jgi:poly-gamma-glutamate capsule biosynthesis protein CapA/YwtB (metallophosphatase superfamily)
VDVVRILLVGDVMLGRGVNDVLRYAEPDYPWGDTLPLFHRADIRICNLECALSDGGQPWPGKEFHFRTDAKNASALIAAGIDAVALANNHTLDFGTEALADTLAGLDRAGIGHAGAGLNLADAQQPAIISIGQRKLGMVAFTDNEPDWEAGEHSPGVAYMPVDLEDERATRLFESIQRWRPEVDILVVSAHWGPNWGYEPPMPQPSFARRLIDLGADIVFGHSGHVFRGVEIYHGRPVIYCAGNFIDDYAVDELERNDQSFVFMVEQTGRGLARILLYPTVIANCQVNLARGARAHDITSKMIRLSAKFGTNAWWNGGEGVLEIPIAD